MHHQAFDILVFKTNILEHDKPSVANVMDNDHRIAKWNVDCSDVDHVLRVEVRELCVHDVMRMIHQAGFVCEELVD